MPGKYLPGQYRDIAREAFRGDDDIDIEECATAIVAEGGAWVAARVWISDSDVEAWRGENEPDAERRS